MILVAPIENKTLVEYPAIKHISSGPKMSRNNGIEVNNEALTFIKMIKLFESGAKSYKSVYEMYKNVAEEYNIDLFFCDLVPILNDACIDIAHTLKKPVVGLIPGLLSNYKPYFFFLILFLF